MSSLLPNGKQYYETSAGIPLVGGKVYTYDAGTTNPRVTYSDAAGTIPNANPVILDARGEATIFWSGAYKVILKDALDNTIWTVDGLTSTDAFVNNLSDSASAAHGAGMVAWNPTLAYAAGTVGAKLNELLSFNDFGAIGDGIANDTAICAAVLLLTSANNIDCNGKTYKITQGLNKNVAAGASFRAVNFNLKSSGVPNNTVLFNVTGPGVTSTATINVVAQGVQSLTVTAGAVNVGDWLRVAGTNLWNDTLLNNKPNITMGEWQQALSSAGGVVGLDSPLRYDYTAGPTAEVTGMASWVSLENIQCTSDNTGFLHIATQIQYAVIARQINVQGFFCSNAGASWDHCVYHYSEDCGDFDPNAALGFAYGVVSGNTARSIIHMRPRGRGCRHVAAHGGTSGVIASTSIYSPSGDNQQEGIVDAHAAVDHQQVIFGDTCFSASANSKLISSEARRLTVIGAKCEGIATGVSWSPSCTAYNSSLDCSKLFIRSNSSAVLIGINSPRQCDYVKIEGTWEGGLAGVSGDGVQCTHSSNLNALATVPGIIQYTEIRGHSYGQQRGVYFITGPRGQTWGDIVVDVQAKAPNVAGSYPVYFNFTNVTDSRSITLRGSVDGGATYGARFDNCNIVDCDVKAFNTVTDALFNNRSADVDALNRFKLRAVMASSGAKDQRFVSFNMNGTTGQVVACKNARALSLPLFTLTNPVGTVGQPYISAITPGVSVTVKSTQATDTSAYNLVIDNPLTGP